MAPVHHQQPEVLHTFTQNLASTDFISRSRIIGRSSAVAHAHCPPPCQRYASTQTSSARLACRRSNTVDEPFACSSFTPALHTETKTPAPSSREVREPPV